LALILGQRERAAESFEEALLLAREQGDKRHIGFALMYESLGRTRTGFRGGLSGKGLDERLGEALRWEESRNQNGNSGAKVEFHFGELFPRVGFIVTTLETESRAVVRFYNKRGTAEQWIKAGKEAVKLTRLSCHRFRANEVRLALPQRIDTWSLTSLQQRLIGTCGRLVKHARYYWLLLAEGHLTRTLFGAILQRLTALSVPAG
jgi:hypothetical protein